MSISSLRRNFKKLEVENAMEDLRKKVSQDMEEFNSRFSESSNTKFTEFKRKVKNDFEKLQSRVNGDMNEMKQRISNIEKSVADMDLKINLLENKTKNGEIIWKIDKIDWQMEQAKRGKLVALDSAPCYTEQYQYKFCIRLYLNGDGIGRSTHISIFFVLMKSEYDPLLQWPMYKKIKFELINQEDSSDNIVESIITNPRSYCFQRPLRNMNEASGLPMFVSIEKFLEGGFVRDNCAYFKTAVKDVSWMSSFLGE